MTECDEIISVIDIVSTKKISVIVTKNCHSKKVTDCHILQTILLEIILQLKITNICYHYAKQKGII